MAESRTKLSKRPIELGIRRLTPSATLPEDGLDFSRGFTLYADLTGPLRLAPTQTAVVTTGLSVSIPSGYTGMILSRRGLSQKHSIALLDAPTPISCTFTGELRAVLHNHGRKPFTLYHGAEIAQFMILPVPDINLTMQEDYDEYDSNMP